MKRNSLLYDGDIIRLRVLCRIDNFERKSLLKVLIATGGEFRRLSPPKSKVRRSDSKSKMIYVSWEHYNQKKKKFCIVKSEKGGGSKQMKFLLSTSKQTIMEQCIDHF